MNRSLFHVMRRHLLRSVLLCLGAGMLASLFGCSSAVEPQIPPVSPGPSPVTEPQKVSPPEKEQALHEQSFRLEELSVLEERGQTILSMKFSGPVKQYRHFTLGQPSRIVLDVFGESKQLTQVENYRVDTSWVGTLRLSSGEGYLRLVMEISAGTVPAYEINPENGKLKVMIGTVNPQVLTKREMQLVQGGKRVERRSGEAAPAGVDATAQAPASQAAVGSEKQYTGQRVSLDFKDADIKNVFRLLAEISGLNMVVTQDVQRRVTIRLVDVPWDQAMDLLIDTNGLAKEQVGNVVRISTAGSLRAEKDAILAARKAQDSVEPLETAYFSVNYAKARDVVEKVLEKIKPTLSPRGTVVPDDRSNIIVVRDVKKGIDDATAIISRLDIRTPQVLIESNLIETTPTFARALGFELGFTTRWNAQSSSSLFPRAGALGTSPTTSAQQGAAVPGLFPGGGNVQSIFPAADPFGALGGTLSIIQDRLGFIQNLTATLTAAEQEGNIKIISRPSIVTLNNVESTIKSERILRIQLPSGGTSTVVGGSGSQQTVAVQDIPVGITLKVTPQVASDGFVLMKIDVKTSSLGTQSSGSVIPDELSRQAIANVLVRDGETIVIGGIMKDTTATSEGGIPYLKDIPVLGWLFKNIRLQKDFEELMVFITPRIVAGGSENVPTAEQLWREQMRKTQ